MNQLLVNNNQLAGALEWIEAGHWSKLYAVEDGLQCYSSSIAGARALAMPAIDILAMNRVIGLGISRPFTSRDLEQIIRFYAEAGSKRFFIQIAPHFKQSGRNKLLEDKGFRHFNNWAKLIRPTELPAPEMKTDLQIVEIGKEKADLFSQIILFSFGWEGSLLARCIASPVGTPGFHHYLVRKDNRAIAAGALFIENKIAAMAFAATLPEYRGLGAQSLLLKTRIEKARASGCTHIISETAEDLADEPVKSYRNMLKMGFQQAYLRENWLCAPGA